MLFQHGCEPEKCIKTFKMVQANESELKFKKSQALTPSLLPFQVQCTCCFP